MDSVAKNLSATEIVQAQQQAQKIKNSIERVVNPDQFVFVAAFDGTKNDRDNLSLSGTSQMTNVAQIEKQISDKNIGNANLASDYYPGPGTDDSLFASSIFPTQQVINTAQLAYDDFGRIAALWLVENVGGSVTAMVTSFSRGGASAAIFSQMLYEKGLVDPDTGKLLIPPGQVGVSAGAIIDPVFTGFQEIFNLLRM